LKDRHFKKSNARKGDTCPIGKQNTLHIKSNKCYRQANIIDAYI